MSLINPFKLLGVNIDSSLNEIKKSYYNLALLCHPDKGGAEKDMIIISKAYEYVKDQISNINTDKTYEDLEKEFEDFCKKQTAKPPTFSKIYEETNDWIKEFNREFEIKDFDPFKDGYGNIMDETETKTKYLDKEDNEVTNSFNKIIEYSEPQSLPNNINFYPLNREKINDFSLKLNNFEMTDYMKAFTKQETDINFQNYDIDEKYEEEIKKRNYN